MLSASFQGIVSDAVYLLAFLIPFAIGFYYSKIYRREREEERGLAEPLDHYLTVGKEQLVDFLPIILPAVSVIFLLALSTSLLLGSLGFSGSTVEEQGIFTMIAVHAIAPAILEEALFRYIPMKLIAPYSRRMCILYSSLYFALIHASLFQMPYAFAAGIILMTLDLALDSVLPSLILHLVNNTISVVCMKYCLTNESLVAFSFILVGVACLSLIPVFIKRERYLGYIRTAFDKGVGYASTNASVALIAVSLYIAFMNLFA